MEYNKRKYLKSKNDYYKKVSLNPKEFVVMNSDNGSLIKTMRFSTIQSDFTKKGKERKT